MLSGDWTAIEREMFIAAVSETVFGFLMLMKFCGAGGLMVDPKCQDPPKESDEW